VTPGSDHGAFEERLITLVGEQHVLLADDVTAAYEVDWTGRWRGRARAVVRPATTDEVAAVVRACAAEGVAIVPQGGNTGLVGGGVPARGEVLLSLRRLDHVDAVDLAAAQVTAGAGVTLATLQQHARTAGLDVGVDFAARDSATLGGMVATNAGGERVLRYGTTRAHVRGLEAVMADGRVISRLSGLAKDNVGFDVGSLLVGSEGTLAVITRVRLALVPHLGERVAALLAMTDTAEAVRTVAVLRGRLPSLEAAELFDAAGLDLVCEAFDLPHPLPGRHPVYVLVECADHRDPTDELAVLLAEMDHLADVAIAADPWRREALWRYRDRLPEAVNAAGIPLKLDVAVPLAELPGFEADARAKVAEIAPDARVVVFGHLGEGNLHVNVLGVAEAADRVTGAVLRLVAERRGSISAEHGVGRAKAAWVHLSRSDEELAAMRSIKAALDPHGLLNPGVIFADVGVAPPSQVGL
jgi:FAD/FMN-containing dehydrogenase